MEATYKRGLITVVQLELLQLVEEFAKYSLLLT